MKAKTILLSFWLLVTIAGSQKLTAQDKITISLLQDAKLGLGLDKKHKNTSPTLDILINVNLEGMQFEHYYFCMQMQYEYANLYDGYYSRYGVNAIWFFNQLIIPKLKIGAGAGLHMINRHKNEGNGSYSFTFEFHYPIVKNLFIVNKNEFVRRSDLFTPKLGYNLSIGLNYSL